METNDNILNVIKQAIEEKRPSIIEMWKKAKGLLTSAGLRPDPMAVAMLVGPISMQDGEQVERMRLCLVEAVKILKDVCGEREVKKVDPGAAVMMAGVLANACEGAIRKANEEVNREMAATVQSMLELAAQKIADGDSVEGVYAHILLNVQEAYQRPVPPRMQSELMQILKQVAEEAEKIAKEADKIISESVVNGVTPDQIEKAMHKSNLGISGATSEQIQEQINKFNLEEAKRREQFMRGEGGTPEFVIETMTPEQVQEMVDNATPAELKEMLSLSDEEAKAIGIQSDALPDAPPEAPAEASNVVEFAPKKPTRNRPRPNPNK